jgi:hypothetical protein
LAEAAKRLKDASPGKRVVLFLDQFERATAGFDLSAKEDRGRLAGFLKQQVMAAPPDATIVLVVVDDTALIQLLWQACMDEGVQAGMVACTHLERKDVAAIIDRLATAGGLQFDQRIIDEMLQSYEQTRGAAPELRFTLAHIQAVCHMLAATRTVEYESYRRAFDNDLRALHQAINVCDIISFVEDFPWSDASWFRNMIKVALKENKERIAEFIKAHFDELMPPPPPPRKRQPVEWPAYVRRTP